jgi:vitamin B12 transporter
MFLVVALALAGLDGGVQNLARPSEAVIPFRPVKVQATVEQSEQTLSLFDLREPTSPVTTIDLQHASREGKELAEVLLQAPGVIVQDTGGIGTPKSISVRGASPNAVLVLLDGVPLTNLGNAFDVSRIQIGALDQVQVLRGASTRLGLGGLGGGINLISKRPQHFEVLADISVASFETVRANVVAATPLFGGHWLATVSGLTSKGNFLYRFDATPNFEDGTALIERAHNAVQQLGFLSKYQRLFGQTQVDVMLEGLLDSQALAGTVQNPTTDARRGVRGTISARTNTAFTGAGQLTSLSFARLDDATFQEPFLAAGMDSTFQREWALGTEFSYSQLVGRHGFSALASLSGEFLQRGSSGNPSRFRVGLMLSDEATFLNELLGLNASVRVDTAGPLVLFSPKLGAQLNLPRHVALKVSAGQASRPPSFFELYVRTGNTLPNSELRPERALTADLTLEWKTETLSLATTGFGHLYEDLILYEFYPPFLARPFNVMAASVLGLEFAFRYEPTSFVSLSLDYTFLSTQNLRDDPRFYLKPLPYRPTHRLFSRVDFGVPMLKGHLEVLAQSAQFINRTATVELEPRAFVNWGVSSRLLQRPQVTVALEVKNLFDVQSQDFDGYPLLPRGVFATLAFGLEGEQK